MRLWPAGRGRWESQNETRESWESQNETRESWESQNETRESWEPQNETRERWESQNETVAQLVGELRWEPQDGGYKSTQRSKYRSVFL